MSPHRKPRPGDAPPPPPRPPLTPTIPSPPDPDDIDAILRMVRTGLAKTFAGYGTRDGDGGAERLCTNPGCVPIEPLRALHGAVQAVIEARSAEMSSAECVLVRTPDESDIDDMDELQFATVCCNAVNEATALHLGDAAVPLIPIAQLKFARRLLETGVPRVEILAYVRHETPRAIARRAIPGTLAYFVPGLGRDGA